MLQSNNQAIQAQNEAALHEAYNKYGSMLYGFLLNVVKDAGVAEQYLISIFDDLSKAINETGECGPYTWCGLYRMAKSKLINTVSDEDEADHDLMIYALGNEMYNGMNDLQKQIFYQSYYNGKSISQLAAKLNQSEESIRKTLKEAFLILRRGGN